MRLRVEYLTDGVLRGEPPHASCPTSKTLRVNFAYAVFKRKVDKEKIGELLSAKSLVVVLTPHGTLPA